MYDFDEVIERRGTRCVKFDALEERFGRSDLLPLWVADMDFRTPDFILDALRRRLEHPVLGYPCTGDDYFEIVSRWVEDLHGWKVPASCFRYVPGIVKGLGFAERCFLQSGDEVVIQKPVYHPFRIVTEESGFTVVNNPLRPLYDAEGFLTGYEMDLEDLERKIGPRTRMLILCNPHNPGGATFPAETLRRLAEICDRHGLIVLSDEIHAEMVHGGVRHVPFASVSEEAARCSITFMAPSKTFNIAGVVSSYAIVQDRALADRFFKYLESNETDYPPIFSAEATRAAYTPQGRAWREEMLAYVQGNIDFVDAWLRGHLPQIRAVRPQASFLVWLDCRKLGLSQPELVDLFVNRAHLALNDGTVFGPEGEGFMRLNVGCPRSVLQKALEALAAAVWS
ncbi:MAG: pyridoxal phosphate-dependent aminotransferase [Bacteroidales bacterium]|nr:pyridoxal phosphate-dependent aminotransferase [Bacteroidales bacterium]